MPVEITIPSPGESITEVTLGPWQKSSGMWVERDEILVEIESDKVTLELPAPASGLLSVNADEGAEMNVGDVIGSIDESAAKPANGTMTTSESPGEAPAAAPTETAQANEVATQIAASSDSATRATSMAKKIAADQGVNLASLAGSGPAGRIMKADVINAKAAPTQNVPVIATPQVSMPLATTGERGMRREKMSKLRRRIAERLVQAQHDAAMLTTFNECDMTEVMRLRKLHKESFAEKYGVGLGFMSFFVKSCASALREYPRVNAYIVGDEIEFHDYTDISIAVGTEKGLVVPVLRDVQDMSFADVESSIRNYAGRARENKLTIDEMTGGTFTISNGGTYGSLNSTPILNPPQSGILGMHAIKKRAVEDPDNPGQVVIRPMMYLAMSYDHRIVDGAEAVVFLVHVKNCIENPERMLLGL
ncbi:MAG: 2-oxoglutarate dehydrogenase complex dihydrolipoyllysine-residue succinyltransferase [Planctomycetota bacterium]|nr:2-oxoglutarate dehydrogenase complex dihydrolipoyllysine-residue succinyltransferase [Planctomycetota bacterium]